MVANIDDNGLFEEVKPMTKPKKVPLKHSGTYWLALTV
jgi:hypothetical protein